MSGTPTRAIVTAACLPVLAAAGTVSAAEAGAAGPPTIREVAVRPTPVVLPASAATKATTAVTITLKVADADGVDTVVAGVYPPGARKGIAVRAKRTGGTAKSGIWTARFSLNGTRPVGTWTVQAFATDAEQNTTNPSQVYARYDVLTPTRLVEFDVAEPVEGGDPLEIEGLLQRWDGKAGWVAYPDREVAVQFRRVGSKSFKVVETVRTDDDGAVTGARAFAEEAGTWRLSFGGVETRAASVSREDEVAVTEPKVEPSPTPTAPDDPAAPTARSTATPAPTASAQPTSTVRPKPSAVPSARPAQTPP